MEAAVVRAAGVATTTDRAAATAAVRAAARVVWAALLEAVCRS